MIMWFFAFTSIFVVYYIFDLYMLNSIKGIKANLVMMYICILFAGILLRIFESMFIRDIGLQIFSFLFSFSLSVFFSVVCLSFFFSFLSVSLSLSLFLLYLLVSVTQFVFFFPFLKRNHGEYTGANPTYSNF